MQHPFKLYLSNLSTYHFDAKQNIYFLFFLRGKTKLKINQNEVNMITNDFVLTEISNQIEIIARDHTLAYIFEMDELSLLSRTDHVSLFNFYAEDVSAYAKKQISSRFFSLVNHFFDSKKNNLLIESSLLLFLDALRQVSNQESLEQRHFDVDFNRVQHIKRYIHQNMNSRISIEELAKELFLTPQYLSRYIKEKFGMTYIYYISKLRLKFAEKDLIDTNLSLTAIAHQRGYANVNALISAFKKFNEMTPKAYRDSFKNKIVFNQSVFDIVSEDDKLIAKEQTNEYIMQLMDNGQTSNMDVKSIHIDIKQGEINEKNVSKTINLGFARNLLSNSFQDQLSKLQNDLSFTYARFQGIFEHGIIDRIPNTDFYNFSKANRIIDLLYANQLLPFVELGNKPDKINLSAEHYISLSENNRLYRNPTEWQQLVKGFIKNCINRYGTSEVSKWIFDYWYPHGKALEYSLSYAENYISNYRILYDSIKHYLPIAMVGGMSLNLTAHELSISSILNYMFIKKVPFDFISITAFHTEALMQVPTLTTNPLYLLDKVNALKKLCNLTNTPLILAEWSFDVSTRNFVHDSIFMASFIIKNLIEQGDIFHDMAYWLMSDLMIEFSDTNQVLFGGNGLLSVDGLPKPSYFAYQFFRKLGKRIIQKGDGYIVTSDSMDSYQILLYHYHHPSEKYCNQYQSTTEHDQIGQIFDNSNLMSINIKLDHLVKGHYRVKTSSIADGIGSILDQWIHLGATSNLSSSEIQYLKHMTQPGLRIEYTDETDIIYLSESIRSHEIKLIQVSLDYKEST